MVIAPEQNRRWTRWGAFASICLIFFFVNFASFNSLGVVLFVMTPDLHWSMTAAGFNFTLLGLACGLSSPFPALLMPRLGGRGVFGLGSVFLVLAFCLASACASLWQFDAAMVLLGIGVTFCSIVPAIYLITQWFEAKSAPVIGVYFMFGALGAAVGPPLVEAILSQSGGWRGYWRMMAATSVVLGLVCLWLIRDARPSVPARGADIDSSPRIAPQSPGAGAWSARDAVFTLQFALVAAAQAATMGSVTTNSSIVVNHLVKLGSTPTTGALVLSAIAITATLVKAVAGRLCELVQPARILSAGLVLQGAGNLMLAVADGALLQYGGAIVFGVGWGLAFVSGTVVLINYFGSQAGSQSLSVLWSLTTVAAAGPLAAGMLFDRYGSFAAVFNLFAALFLLIAVAVFFMHEPAIGPARKRLAGAA